MCWARVVWCWRPSTSRCPAGERATAAKVGSSELGVSAFVLGDGPLPGTAPPGHSADIFSRPLKQSTTWPGQNGTIIPASNSYSVLRKHRPLLESLLSALALWQVHVFLVASCRVEHVLKDAGERTPPDNHRDASLGRLVLGALLCIPPYKRCIVSTCPLRIPGPFSTPALLAAENSVMSALS